MNTVNPFVDYWRSLSKEDRQRYAMDAGTTVKYIETHLISVPPRKVPRPALMSGLVVASRGRVSQSDILEHFYQVRGQDQFPRRRACQ